jgi:hypothetical protein
MFIAFTICSNNYLAHAKTLGDSFLEYHPEAKFIIGLVDKYDTGQDYTFFSDFEIIPVEEISIVEFEELNLKYNISELNTAVKPSYLHFIFKKYAPEKLLYIDPDILVTSRFDEVLNALDIKNIILTPHICSPIDDEFAPTDFHTLRGGIFNLGFIGLSKYEMVKGFITWWHQRVVKYGFADFRRSMFYDQLWINYVPAFFDNYTILKHPGYNMANWNLHERVLSKDNKDCFIVNDYYPLRFFHFSGYKFTSPDSICSYLTRYNFETRPDLISIFNDYQNKLIKNRVGKISQLPVFYYPYLNVPSGINNKKNPYKHFRSRLRKAVRVLITGHV